MKLPIYLDNHATTPLDPRVLEVMLPCFTTVFGNASSRNHTFGWDAEKLVTQGREQVAKIIGASLKEIVFTSGATESDNLAIKGVAEMYREQGNHIITATTEHKAVLDACKKLEQHGYEVTYLPVDSKGLITAEQVKDALTDKTILVSIMAVNNEIGVVQPLKQIGQVTREAGVLFHSDATQGIGKIDIDVDKMNIDLLSMSAHKIYGPKGIGALYVRRRNPRVRLSALIDGGGHERGMRSGTLNVPGIVGFGMACELAASEIDEENTRLLRYRQKLMDGLNAELDELYVNGDLDQRVPHNLNISFAYVEGESLLMGINENIAVSSGSACTSASLEPSYVLRALGIGDELAHTSIRFGLGRFTTEEEIDYTIKKFVSVVKRLRDMSPLYDMAREGIDLKSVQWTE